MTDIPKAKSGWLSFFLKLSFFAIAFVLVVVTVLGNMGGRSDFHRQSLEQFATENTKLNAKIGNLIGMTYFPTISADFEDMNFFPLVEGASSVAHVDKVQAAFSFTDVFMKNGKIKILNVQGIDISAGILFAKPVNVKHFSIMDNGTETAHLAGEGTIGSAPVTFNIAMIAEGEGRQRKFHFPPRRAVTMNIGDVALATHMINAVNPYLSFQETSFSLASSNVVSGALSVSKRREHEMTITGELKAEANGTIFKPDLIYDITTRKITGTITSDNFNAADFAETAPFTALIKKLVEYLGDPSADATALDEFAARHDITLDLKGASPYQGKLQFKNNVLVLQ